VKPAPLEYVRVTTVADALAALARFDGNARLLAGGQSLVPLLSMRLLRPTAVIDITAIPGLDRITPGDGVVRVGALARYASLEASSLVRERIPLLARAVPFVGDRQIRNRGTLGGALCHADPAGEMALCALTLGARLRIAGAGGRRQLTSEEFFQGPYTTALDATDMLEEIEFPDGAGTEAVVLEHARRHGDFAVVSVAVTGQPDADGTWRWIRIGLGAVADRPRYAERASALLAGTRLPSAAVREAAQRCLEEAEPASDVRASAEYRLHLIPILVERALTELARHSNEPRGSGGVGGHIGAPHVQT
jgi:carbon-monoxide dehydrogenase medium subunit